MTKRIGPLALAAIAVTGLAAAGASAQTAGEVRMKKAVEGAEACTVATSGVIAFHKDGALTTAGEHGAMTVRVMPTEAGEATVVARKLEAATVEGRDGEHRVVIRELPSEKGKVVIVDGKSLEGLDVKEKTTEGEQKFHVKRPAAKTETHVLEDGTKVTVTRAASAGASVFSVDGKELKPVECNIIVRTVKDDNQF
jgi:hypothetical protein